jgi:hypothetical protein
MATPSIDLLALADWETIGLKLLVFTRYWARTHYSWLPDRALPGGKTPEDVATEAYTAFACGQRKLRSDRPLMLQLKGAVRSILWNIHRAKEEQVTTELTPEQWLPLSANDDPAATVEWQDFQEEFWRRLKADRQVQRSADLAKTVEAIEAGAESVDDLCAATGLATAQVYELRRRLKDIAETIFTQLQHDTPKERAQ